MKREYREINLEKFVPEEEEKLNKNEKKKQYKETITNEKYRKLQTKGTTKRKRQFKVVLYP